MTVVAPRTQTTQVTGAMTTMTTVTTQTSSISASVTVTGIWRSQNVQPPTTANNWANRQQCGAIDIIVGFAIVAGSFMLSVGFSGVGTAIAFGVLIPVGAGLIRTGIGQLTTPYG